MSSPSTSSADSDKSQGQVIANKLSQPSMSEPASNDASNKPKGLVLGFAAVLGAVGNVMAFFDKLPLNGKVNIIVVLVLCLGIIVFAILTLRENDNSRIITALSVTTLVVGIIGLIYFIPIFIVLQFTSSPPIRGYPVSETSNRRHDALIQSNRVQKSGSNLSLSHELSFNEDADFAQVEIAVPEQYKRDVKSLSVEAQRPTGAKISTMPRKGPTIDGFYIEPVLTSTKVPVTINLTLEGKSAVPPPLNVFYKYWRKDFLWRVMEWIHGRYA
jgi:hypothetical protein